MILCVCHNVAISNHRHVPGMPYMCGHCRKAVLGTQMWQAYVHTFNTDSILLTIQEDFGA